jgi:hypothetical protein
MVYLEIPFQRVAGTRRGNIASPADEQDAHPFLPSSHQPSAPETRPLLRGAIAPRKLVSAHGVALPFKSPLSESLGILFNFR